MTYDFTLENLLDNQQDYYGVLRLYDQYGNCVFGTCKSQGTWWTSAYENGEKVMYMDSSGNNNWDIRNKPKPPKIVPYTQKQLEERLGHKFEIVPEDIPF